MLGIDIGGTGIKGALVDVEKGEFAEERIKINTPQPATPEAMLKTVKKIIKGFDWEGKPIGIGFPAIIKNGTVLSASNIDKTWMNYDAKANWEQALKAALYFINDADAAGLAEIKFGSGPKLEGVVLFLTLGTGIGSSLFQKGHLIPNTELGHLIYKSKVAEKVVSNSAREGKKMTWKAYGKILNGYLQRVSFLINPDHIILGGGISKKFETFKPFLDVPCNITNATLLNDAGIIGAAYYASQRIAKSM